MQFKKYKQNLFVADDGVFSYETLVARIDHKAKKVISNNWFSQTTSKHINYVAKELGYTVDNSIWNDI